MKRTLDAIGGLYERALSSVRSRVSVDGKPDGKLLEQHQLAAHGLA